MVEPTGYTALDIIGFTDKGPYDPTANYVKNDLVHVGNSTWRCKIDDTTGITPTEGANWTIFIESATSLAGMSDVDLNTPKAGDGLVHDGNDWTNIPIMTKEQWKKNGAYNHLPLNISTIKSLNTSGMWAGNTFTPTIAPNLSIKVNDDYTIEVSGYTSNDAVSFIMLDNPTNLNFNGMLLCGCPSGGSASTYDLSVYDATAHIQSSDYGSGVIINAESGHNFNVFFRIRANQTLSDTIIFKPMATTDPNATYDDYVPHAMTNRELTEGVLKADYVTLTSHNITAGNVYDYALPSTYNDKKVIAISPVTVGPSGWGSTVPAVFSGINIASKLVTVRAYVTGDYSPRVLVFYRDV